MKPTQASLVAEYCEKYSAFPSYTLSRLVYKEHPEAFTNVNGARQAINYVRGKQGDRHRKNKTFANLRDTENHSTTPQIFLPRTWANPKNVFKLPKSDNRIGFMSDFQVPFQDNQAIEAFFIWLKKRGINTLFLNGDLVDFYRLSFFQQDPRKRNFKAEFTCILQFLEYLRHVFPNIKIYYNLEANHELRYERYMSLKAPEMLSLDLPDYSIENLLRLSLFDIIPLKRNHHILIGKLPVIHGHTIFKGTVSPVATARTVFMKTNMSAIASHCHQVNEITKTKINGEMITCWTTGCFMDLNVEYNQHGNNYSHGGAYIETDDSGVFHVENKRIDKGVVL